MRPREEMLELVPRRMVLPLRSRSVLSMATVIWRFRMMTARFRPVSAHAFSRTRSRIRGRTISGLVSYWRPRARACGLGMTPLMIPDVPRENLTDLFREFLLLD